TFDIEDVTGPFISADAHSDLTVDSTASPWWKLTGGFEAGGGLKFNVFGLKFDKEDGQILLKDWTIAEATAPAPLTIATKILAAADQGAPYSDTLSAIGGTSPYTWSISQ